MSETMGGGDVDNRKWWAKAIMVGGVVAAVCLPLGALGAKVGIWGFQGGFMLLAVGTVLATIAFFLGIVAYVVCINKKLIPERKSILVGVAISAVILVVMGMQFSAATSVPAIHNISTDTERPPQFDTLVAVREAEGANPLAYDAAALAAPQRQAYPYVKPLISAEPPAVMLDRAVQVLEDMGVEIVDVNETAGRVEATATTFWFGFKDDVVVRVRPEGSGSVVDVRSVSRVGQSDLGANARRIGEILNGLGANNS
jgi:uncharacterized protein (DUF1499 family)